MMLAAIGETLGIVGAAVGIAGAIFGTVIPIMRCKSPAERRFGIRAAVVVWLLLLVLLTSFGWLQRTSPDYTWVPWLVYSFILIVGIRYMNKRQLELRNAAQQDRIATKKVGD